MKVLFAGVGEAFDETQPNTSILLQSGGRLLLDCGFTAAAAYWRHAEDPGRLDAVWISHFHGDHYFGLPALLLKLLETERTSPLTVIGPKGIEERTLTLCKMAYGSILDKKRYALRFLEAEAGKRIEAAGFSLTFALNGHSQSSPCLGIHAESGGRSVYYSGDGRPTPETAALAEGANLVIHEAYGLEPDTPGHGTVQGSIDFARASRAKALALVHLNHAVRRAHEADVREKLADIDDFAAFLPESGSVYEF